METASRRVVAGVLSAFIPGLGLFVRHRWKSGLLVLLTTIAFVIAAVLILVLTPADSDAAIFGSLACLFAALVFYIVGVVLSVQKGVPAPATVVAVEAAETEPTAAQSVVPSMAGAVIEIARYADGRPLVWEQQTGSLSIGDAPVSLEDAVACDRAGQLSWVGEEQRAWAYSALEMRAEQADAEARRARSDAKMRANCAVASLVIAIVAVAATVASFLIAPKMPDGPVPNEWVFIGMLVLPFALAAWAVSFGLGLIGRSSVRRGFAIAGIAVDAVLLTAACGLSIVDPTGLFH